MKSALKRSLIPRRMSQLHFHLAWKLTDRKRVFEICNTIRVEMDLPPFTLEKFEDGWQYRTVFHENYRTARHEMFNLVIGWW